MGALRRRLDALAKHPAARVTVATFTDWRAEDGPMIAAAMSYYALVSLAPLALVIVSAAGLYFERQAVRDELLRLAAGALEPGALPAVRAVLDATASGRPGPLASVAAVALALAGAVGLFAQLQRALNRIWDAPEPPRDGIAGVLKRRLASFLMVVAIGVLVGLAVVANAAVGLIERVLPATAYVTPAALRVGGLVASFVPIAAGFAVMYRVLPDVVISWRDVVVGSLVTAALFTLANLGVGLYFTYSSIGSVFGTAGSLAVLLVWMYLVGQAVLIGASFTHVWACTHGSLRRGASPCAASRAKDA